MPTLPSSNTVTMTISLDKTATLSRSTYIGNQGEQLVITVVVPTGISGSGYDAYIDFTQPDGLSYFKGPYDCSTGTFDFTLGALDSIMDKDGVIYWQFLLCTTVGDVRTVNWSAKRYKTEILSSVGATTSAILPYVPQMVFPDTYPAGNITIADVGGILVGNTVEDALQEVEGQIVDIASTNINKGASLVGIHDVGNIITAVNAEDAIQENAANVNLVEGRMTTAEDNITTLQTNPSCRVYKATAQSIPTATDVVLTFDVELFDAKNMHSNTVNNDRITITEPGVYLVVGHVGFSINSSGKRAATIKKNGGIICQVEQLSTLDYPVLNPTALINCVAGDYLNMTVNQSSGSSVDVIGLNYTCSFSAVKVAN